ncbi:hypothetical protein JCM10908_007141 [Rhodotorula pacifica]|uniref:uncharacterized protein n=1 Tax=Rhodotorula pacifica TaxID=1495444 RepID=UPI00316B30F4
MFSAASREEYDARYSTSSGFLRPVPISLWSSTTAGNVRDVATEEKPLPRIATPTLKKVATSLQRLPSRLKRPLSHLFDGVPTKRRKVQPPTISVVDARPIGVDRAKALGLHTAQSRPLISAPAHSAPAIVHTTASAPEAPRRPASITNESSLRSASPYIPRRPANTSGVSLRRESSRPGSSLSSYLHQHRLEAVQEATTPPLAGPDPVYPPLEVTHAALHSRIQLRRSLESTRSSASHSSAASSLPSPTDSLFSGHQGSQTSSRSSPFSSVESLSSSSKGLPPRPCQYSRRHDPPEDCFYPASLPSLRHRHRQGYNNPSHSRYSKPLPRLPSGGASTYERTTPAPPPSLLTVPDAPARSAYSESLSDALLVLDSLIDDYANMTDESR